MRRIEKLSVVALGALVIASCDKAKDPVDPNEEETITTVKLNFVDQSDTSNTFVVQYADPDGIGGNPPTIDTLFLENGKTYTVTSEFWNESVNPSEDMTAEIVAESDEHLICFEGLNNLDFSFVITDMDVNSLPIGLSSDWTVNSSNNGDVQVSLKHQPDGIKNGTCNIGDTDVEVVFPVIIF